jgi:NADH:ubiquinone oxidoreductase subunit 5 (subunit L)/multisubunit Na+/H+ antiporter MnhA subunit
MVAGVGLLTGLVGISLALQQREVKRALAYSSIENIGLIGLALGVGLWGWAHDNSAVAVLGITAALLHTWNHALMKGLMFFSAGSVLHGTGTQDVEKLGGLMKRMPWTGSAMTVGAVALTALPPLNGFVSKWVIYLGLLRSGLANNDSYSLTALFAAGLLTLIGGLAAIAFVRLTGIVLLGSPRSEAAQHAHESSLWLLCPMMLLVVLCLGAAILPVTITGWMVGPLNQVLGNQAGQTLLEMKPLEAPLQTVGNLNAAIAVVITGFALVVFALARKPVPAKGSTWGCGYVEPTVRMQYTGRSFAEMFGEHLLPRFLRPQTKKQAPRGLFPSQGEFGCVCPDPVSEKVYEPFFHRWAERFSRLRILQQGKVHIYLIYIVLTVVLALVWVSVQTWRARS